jgi:hypothetical protein
VTVIVYCPDGVVVGGGAVVLDEEELHPERTVNPAASRNMAATPNNTGRRFLPTANGMHSVASTTTVSPSAAGLGRTVSSAAVATLVAKVIVALTAAPLGVTLAGEKVHVVCTGKPEHASDFDALKPSAGRDVYHAAGRTSRGDRCSSR